MYHAYNANVNVVYNIINKNIYIYAFIFTYLYIYICIFGRYITYIRFSVRSKYIFLFQSLDFVF